MKLSRNLALTMVCIILGIIVAAQYRSVYNYRLTASYENKTLSELRDELIQKTKQNEILSKRNQELAEEVRKFQEQIGDAGEAEARLAEELKRLRILAGLETVKGKGVIITLEDNPPAYVEEYNLLELVNELRASDAQAISINDQRLVATSEIREAGYYIMVNQTQIVPPYVIKAIAEPERLEHTLNMIGGIIEVLRERWALKVTVERSDEIIIPKIPDDGTLLRTDLLTPVN